MGTFKVQDLSFRYKNQDALIVNNFSMEVKRGEIVALVGPSGSGKSTILRLLSGLEKPSAGIIKNETGVIYDNNTNLEPQKRNIGMIFQDYALFPHLTVLENVKFGIKGKKSERTKQALYYLKKVQMTEHANKYPHQCSGGQQQRIAIARAIATKPQVLLLDEPFSNLDASLRSVVRKEIRNIIKDENISAVLVTHDKDDVDACADRMIDCLSTNCQCSWKNPDLIN